MLRQSGASTAYETCFKRICKRRRLNAPMYRPFHASVIACSSSDTRTVAIIGGGLGGLSTAHFLLKSLSESAKKSTRVLLIEKASRTGGWCRTERCEIQGEPVLFETGPRSIRPVGLSGWLTVQMANDIGLSSRIVTVPKTAPSARKRYLLMPDSLELEAAPNSIPSLLSSFARSRSFRSAIRGVLSEPFVSRSPIHDNDPADESVDSFLTRRFGKTMAETYASAIIHGIYSGDTRKLSVRAVFPVLWEAERANGSIFRWFWSRLRARRKKLAPTSSFEKRRALETQLLKVTQDVLASRAPELAARMRTSSVWGLQGGLQTLVDELRSFIERSQVQVLASTTINGMKSTDKGWSLEVSNGQQLDVHHLIASSPSTLPASLEAPSIPSSTVAVVSLAFPSTPSPLVPRGFGYLIPRSVPRDQANPHEALGVIFDSDVMPGIDSSDELGLTKLSILFGGSYWLDRDPTAIATELTHDRLVEMALETLRLHFPRTKFPPPLHAVSNVHVNCIPQMPPGIGTRLATLHQRMRAINEQHEQASISLVGGGPSGVGINAVVQNAWEVGTSVANAINSDGKSRVLTGLERWDDE